MVPVRSPIPAIYGLPELQAHLDALTQDASMLPDARLLDQVGLQLTEENTPPLIPILLPPIIHLLKTTTTTSPSPSPSQDPTPLLLLAVKLMTPLSLAQALAMADDDDDDDDDDDTSSILTALRSPLPGANLIGLTVLAKASASPDDAAELADLPAVVVQFITCWLESLDVGVAELAASVLESVLQTDAQPFDAGHDDGLNGQVESCRRRRLWHLIFHQPSTLHVIQRYCTVGPIPSRSIHDVTISQGRLLRLLPRLAPIDFASLTTTAVSDMPEAAAQPAGRGLLQWAALAMVDKSDTLMNLTLVDFFEALVQNMRQSPYALHPTLKNLVKAAVRHDAAVQEALRILPDSKGEEEEPELTSYLDNLLS
ncbi:hypothetical protein XA68_16479 [Ophiocordyceps unilateralis]|uniref:DNA mismatch repair protein HSM3 N-terminal domain-containing protein n=1 Tax=Ophiocordyceps unilateralis TaxID=268505 RepID=A0A2A9P683_OPHUN|nr:hypothetical protein XA68_16479 [Ophiocordyceps unilateralis]